MGYRGKSRIICAVLAAVLMLSGALRAPGETVEPEAVSNQLVFVDAQGKTIRTDAVAQGASLPRPPAAPSIEGRVFVHWYAVDAQLNGNADKKFDFSSKINKDTYLRAHYEASSLPEESPTEAPVTQAPTTEKPVSPTQEPRASAAPEKEAQLPVETMTTTESPQSQYETSLPADKSETEALLETPAVETPEGEPRSDEQPPVSEAPVSEAPTSEPAASKVPIGEPDASEAPATAEPVATPVPETTAAVAPQIPPLSTEKPQNEETPAPAPVSTAQTGTESSDTPTESPEGDTLVSETEVTQYLACFYGANGEELLRLPFNRGEVIIKPELVPEAEGLVFVHWYKVDEVLSGNPLLPYDFNQKAYGLTYLKAYFASPQSSQTPGLPAETPLPGDEDSVRVTLNVNLALPGEKAEDGQFAALLSGNFLSSPFTSHNTGTRFNFPELVFTAEDEGDWTFHVSAVKEEGRSDVVYDARTQVITVSVSLDGEGRVTARVVYPGGASGISVENVLLTAVPLVRVYVNIKKDQKLELGDEVRFTAETVNCGENPLFQWQFSTDNVIWQDIPGAVSSTLDIVIARGNAAGYWRVGVTIID